MGEGTQYLMAGQLSELDRLRLQSRVWEPTGAALLDRLGSGSGSRVVDAGCGAMGWLRILSRWVGPQGTAVGTDIDDRLLDAARSLAKEDHLSNVELAHDDLFDTRLKRSSFDLVHARFQLAPLGRVEEQIATYAGWLKPGGWLVLEDPDSSSWHFNPPAPSAERLIGMILDSFRAAGGNFDCGRDLPDFIRDLSAEPQVEAHILALPPGHPYLRLPLLFAASLEQRLLALVAPHELASLRQGAERELALPGRWGTSFTLIQAWARVG